MKNVSFLIKSIWYLFLYNRVNRIFMTIWEDSLLNSIITVDQIVKMNMLSKII